MAAYRGRDELVEIRTGREGENPPLNVSHISGNKIVLSLGHGDDYRIGDEIEFATDGPLWENKSLYKQLVILRSRGLPFQYQPKDMESPEALMSWWQETGELKSTFKLIYWYHYKRWKIVEVSLPTMGVNGWNGPKPFGS